MALPITSLYAGFLALLLVALSIRVVVQVRAKGKVNYGDAGDTGFARVVRAQGNFIEYVPMALFLIGIAELNGASGTLLHSLGAALVAARLLHPAGLREEAGPNVARVVGTAGTWVILVIAGGLVISQALGAA